MIDIRQTPQYANYLQSTGWIVEKIKGNYYFIKRIPLIGSVLKVQRPEKIIIKDIDNLVKKYRSFQIVIEPKDKTQISKLKSQNYKLNNGPYLPTKTLHIDLTNTKGKLYKNLKKDCKYALRKNVKTKITTYELKDIEEFRNAWKNAVGLKRHIPSTNKLKALKKSFEEDSLFLADKDANSGTIFLIGDKTAYYWQAFTNKEGRKKQSQYKIVWEGILWAKENGAKVLDFEGIYDKRFPQKSWLGFTHFKKSFGGRVLEYPGAFVKTRLPI
jgi:lipid II:glycine glycyltransferase (peptidoglycan interpeptide bridge formation enzyme)